MTEVHDISEHFTGDAKVYVAAEGTPAEEMAQAIKNMTTPEMDAFIEACNRLSEAVNLSPQAELKFRVQCAVNGTEPGPAVNTRYWRHS